MILHFDESFEKSIKKLKDQKIKTRLIKLIQDFENADSLTDIAILRKCKDFKLFIE